MNRIINSGGELRRNDYFINRLVLKYIVNSILGMLSVYAGALIDTVIVGFFMGETGLSAMSLVSPVYLLYYTVGSVIGIGGSVVAGICVGKSDYVKYRRVFTLSLAVMAMLAVVTTTIGLIFLDDFSRILSGGSNTELVKGYLKYYFIGGGFTLLSYIPLYFLKVDGRPQKSSLLFAIYAILNTLLTFLFMSPVCKMGISGASLATSISMAVAAVLGLLILMSGGETKIEKKFLSLADFKDIIINGLPSGFANLLESLRIIVINIFLIGISASLLPTFTVVRNVIDLLNALAIGVASALLPLNSVFFAERDLVSIRSVFKRIMNIGIILTIAASVLAGAFPDAVSSLFGVTSADIIAQDRTALPLACAGTVIAYINIHFTYYFNSIRRTALSNVILFSRMLLWLVLTAIPLSSQFGADGIWFSFTASEILTLVFSFVIIFIIKSQKNNQGLDFLLLRTDNGSEISFSVKNKLEAVMEASEKITGFCRENGIDNKKAMRISLAIEEILQVIIVKCIPDDKEQFIDIRICRFDNNVIMRIRNNGKIFDPVSYYEQNKNDEKMEEELMGLKMIIKATENVDFRRTFGTNNLTITF